jgi:TRAP-type C4-dicarboxylate transport system permease small subunit
MTFLGAAVLWREGSLFRVAFLVYALPPRGRRALNLAIHGLMLLFAVVLAYESWDFAAGTIEMTAFLAWPKKAWYMALPLSGGLMIVYSAAAMARNLLVGRDVLDPTADTPSQGTCSASDDARGHP